MFVVNLNPLKNVCATAPADKVAFWHCFFGALWELYLYTRYRTAGPKNIAGNGRGNIDAAPHRIFDAVSKYTFRAAAP